MTTLDFDPRDHPDEWERIGTDSDGTPVYRPIDTVEGCGGCDNGECCGACPCCSRSRFDVIGHLTVTDETGYTHTVTIRREDLTTTNGAYQAIRDTVTDTLRQVLESNRM